MRAKEWVQCSRRNLSRPRGETMESKSSTACPANGRWRFSLSLGRTQERSPLPGLRHKKRSRSCHGGMAQTATAGGDLTPPAGADNKASRQVLELGPDADGVVAADRVVARLPTAEQTRDALLG